MMRDELDIEGIKDTVQIAMPILLFPFWQLIQSTQLATTIWFHKGETLLHNIKYVYVSAMYGWSNRAGVKYCAGQLETTASGL